MTAKRIFLIAGEQSGDLHGALLVKALKKENPGLSFYGLGGKAMETAGVKILYDLPSIEKSVQECNEHTGIDSAFQV